MYSNAEYTSMHFLYGLTNGNDLEARQLYHERYPERRCPDRKTFEAVHSRLYEHGSFTSPAGTRRQPRRTTRDAEEAILDTVAQNPCISTWHLGMQMDVPHVTIWWLLHEQQLYLYNLQQIQSLGPVDLPPRLRFCL